MINFDFSNWGPFHEELNKEFCKGAIWPISERILHVLVTLGMSDAAIGEYCNVEAKDVADLREDYGIPDRAVLSETVEMAD